MEKPVSAACLRNQEPIARALAGILVEPARVLEIGSGTGQHAVYLARALPHLIWQPTELEPALAGIRAWRDEAGLDNVLEPRVLDVCQDDWPTGPYDAVFTANTVHFIGWEPVRRMFAGVAQVLRPEGHFCIYGPFNENGRYTSEGNRDLDAWLKSRDQDSGIKDRDEVIRLADALGLLFQEDIAMPANNRLLVFRKAGPAAR